MSDPTQHRWEGLPLSGARMKVPGGWLYSFVPGGSDAVYVPNPEEWVDRTDGALHTIIHLLRGDAVE